MPRRKPPAGFLTPLQAIDLLMQHGIIGSAGGFYKFVGEEEGKLHPYGPPGRKHRYYSTEEVQSLINAQESFYTSAIPPEVDAVFSVASAEDIQGTYELAMRLFGRTTSLEQRLSWYRREPRGHYVVKRKSNGAVVAYLTLLPLKHEPLMKYMLSKYEVTDDDIEPFLPGLKRACIIKGIGSDPMVSEKTRAAYTGVLLRGIIQDMTRLASEGVTISDLYAFSSVTDGIFFCLEMGMQIWGRPRKVKGSAKRCCFHMDVMQSASNPFVRGYVHAWQEWHKRMYDGNSQQPFSYPQKPVAPSILSDRQSITTKPRQPATTAQDANRALPEEMSKDGSPSELPEGSMHIQDFLAQHNLKQHRQRIIRYLDAPTNKLHYEAFPGRTPRESERYLTPEQQEALLQWLRERHPEILH